MRALLAAARLQAQMVRSDPDKLIALAVSPLLSLVFLAIVRHAGRDDLVPHAVLAPALIALWSTSLSVAGDVIEGDRWTGVFEPTVAAPAPLAVVVLGRVAAVTAFGMLAFAESWVVAFAVLGEPVPVHHPAAFAAGVAVTVVAMAATSVLMAALVALSRAARTLQNSLTYPLYLLGGVIVPVALLPGWARLAGRLVFLSWASDLLRDAIHPSPLDEPLGRALAVVVLAAVTFAVGHVALARITGRLRRTGAIGHA